MISRRATVLIVLVATALGFVARAVDMGSGSFPVNDGGLFYSLTQDLIHNGFAPPAYTTYNGGAIPFAYPPLGLYLAGVTQVVSGIDLLTLFRVIPLVASCLTIPAAYLVARELTESPLVAGLAATVFGLLPSAFSTQIAGGGVLRAPAYVLALLALHRVADPAANRGKNRCRPDGAATGPHRTDAPAGVRHGRGFRPGAMAVAWPPAHQSTAGRSRAGAGTGAPARMADVRRLPCWPGAASWSRPGRSRLARRHPVPGLILLHRKPATRPAGHAWPRRVAAGGDGGPMAAGRLAPAPPARLAGSTRCCRWPLRPPWPSCGSCPQRPRARSATSETFSRVTGEPLCRSA